MAKQLAWNDFTGGLNLNEASTIADNELAKAQNCFYDTDNRLTSRRGIDNLFNPISDTVTVLATMNAYDGDGTWTAGGDAGTVTTDTSVKKYDAGSVNFDITVTGTSATMSNTGITAVNLTASKATGYFTAWVFLPSITNFTSVTLALGDTLDTTDYDLAVTTNAKGEAFAVGWNLLKWTWADMTATGSVTGSIDEIRFTFTYAGAFTTDTDFRIDGIFWNSPTYNNGVHSLYHVKLSDDTRVTMAASGTNVFLLENDNDWVLLADGYTTGVKFSFLNYKDVISFSNGTDNYSYYEPDNESSAGAVVVEDASSPKAKYLMMVANTAYAAGISGSLSEVVYSTALPTNLLNAVWTGSEKIHDDDTREIVTGISKLPNDAIAVYLEKSGYYVDTVPTTTVIRPLDYDGGCISHRTLQRAGNDTFGLSIGSVFSLAQREGVSGTFGGTSLSDKIQTVLTTGSDLSTSNALKGKHVSPNHYYLNIDTSNSGFPDTCMVLNTKLQAWTEYTNIAANQMVEYEDSSGVWHLIYANVYSGQVKEFETGFDDNGTEIQVKIWTKENDFGDPTLFKEIREMDVSGFLSDSCVISVTDELDGEDSTTSSILGTAFTTSSSGVSLGTTSIGVHPLSGEPVSQDFMQLNLFNVRDNIYNSAFRIQVKLESTTTGSAWILSKIQFKVEALPEDFFPNADYI